MIDVRKLSRVLETRVYDFITPFQNNVIVCPSYHIKMCWKYKNGQWWNLENEKSTWNSNLRTDQAKSPILHICHLDQATPLPPLACLRKIFRTSLWHQTLFLPSSEWLPCQCWKYCRKIWASFLEEGGPFHYESSLLALTLFWRSCRTYLLRAYLQYLWLNNNNWVKQIRYLYLLYCVFF